MDEITDREERIRRLVEAFEEKLRRDLVLGPQTFDNIERQAEEIGESLKKEIVRESTNSCGSGYGGTRIRCCCGSRARYVGLRRRHVIGLRGEIAVDRACYHCASCRSVFAPTDKGLGLATGQCSRRVQSLIARFSSYLPFELAAREIEAVCGVKISATTVQKYAKVIGRNIARDWALKEEALWQGRVAAQADRPKRLYVSMDGAFIHVGGEWREAKLAVAYERSDQGLKSSYFYATMANSSVFGRKMRTLAYIHGALYCADMVFVADGAPWIWMEVGKYFPGKVQILDYYHVTEHLWKIADMRFGPQTDAGSAWMCEQKGRLLDDRASEIITELESWKVRKAAQKDLKRQTIEYMQKHRQRMLYKTFLKQGCHIGSGVMESGCKNVVKARMAGTGMRWQEPGAEAILHLCAHWRSSHQPDYMPYTIN